MSALPRVHTDSEAADAADFVDSAPSPDTTLGTAELDSPTTAAQVDYHFFNSLEDDILSTAEEDQKYYEGNSGLRPLPLSPSERILRDYRQLQSHLRAFQKRLGAPHWGEDKSETAADGDGGGSRGLRQAAIVPLGPIREQCTELVEHHRRFEESLSEVLNYKAKWEPHLARLCLLYVRIAEVASDQRNIDREIGRADVKLARRFEGSPEALQLEDDIASLETDLDACFAKGDELERLRLRLEAELPMDLRWEWTKEKYGLHRTPKDSVEEDRTDFARRRRFTLDIIPD